MFVYIYTLRDINSKYFYIGKSINPEKRFKDHLKECKNKKSIRNKWIFSLIEKNELPILEILDIVNDINWMFYEKYWIEQFKAWGFKLVNGTSGGEGSDGFRNKKHSDKTKKLISLNYKKPTLNLENIGFKKGIDNLNSKLSFEIAEKIRYTYNTEKISMAKLGEKYNVSKNSIRRIIRNICWKNIS